MSLIYSAVLGLVWGAAMGLIPLLLGRYLGKNEWGQIGMICCVISGIFLSVLPPVLAIVFALVIFLSHGDLNIRSGSGASGGVGASGRVSGGAGTYSGGPATYSLRCVSGPLQGQVYRIGANGLTIGRENDCTVRLPGNAGGISRHHCCVRWQAGQLYLVDLGSSYGTYMDDGRQLAPNSPVLLTVGSGFYLGSRQIMFRITN